jgi:hypothetical protein
MKKQIISNITASHGLKTVLKSAKKPDLKKIKKYVYTEKDLGEGLLNSGFKAPYYRAC